MAVSFSFGNLNVLGFQGVGQTADYGLFTPTSNDASYYNPISADLLASANLSFQQQIVQSLGSIQNQGAGLFGGTIGVLQGWAGLQNVWQNTIGNAFADAEHKSTKACSGFFSCLFS